MASPQSLSQPIVHESSSAIDDGPQAARAAGLHYCHDDQPGIARRRHGRGFLYVDAAQKIVRDSATLERIAALVIPPAWTDVWICADPRGHLQATGRDERGRKQYRYHDRWRETRDESKFERMMEFARILPRIRRRVRRDLRKRGMPREKALAAVVRLLETSYIRIGNDDYARKNKSYGLTTLRNHHAQVHGASIHFHFRGKSGVEHDIDMEDPRVARIIRRCQELPGQELFCFLDDDGRAHDIGSQDVNDYLREISGEDFTAKDFRTWAGTVLAARALDEFQSIDAQAQRKKNVVKAIESVAKALGNTRSVCRKCYVHPAVIDAYLDGSFVKSMRQRARQFVGAVRPMHNLRPEEAAVLALLQRRLQRESPRRRKAA